MEKICKVDGCHMKVRAIGYCIKHECQFRKYGKILKRTKYDPNEITRDNKNAYIHLYNQNGNETGIAIIDQDDVEKCKKIKWCLGTGGYIHGCINHKTVYLHNFILGHKSNNEFEPDHKNRNKQDCRKTNLRLCLHRNNSCNIGLNRQNTSGFIGVHFCKDKKRWRALVMSDGKQYYAGYFVDKIEAARARDRAVIKLHGEFAVLNFPNKV